MYDLKMHDESKDSAASQHWHGVPRAGEARARRWTVNKEPFM